MPMLKRGCSRGADEGGDAGETRGAALHAHRRRRRRSGVEAELIGERGDHGHQAAQRAAALRQAANVLDLLMKVGLVAGQAAGHLGELRHDQDGEQAGGDHGAQHHHRHGERQRQETAHQADGGAQDEGEENGDGDRDQDVLAEIERQDRRRADEGDGDGAGEPGVAGVRFGKLQALHGRPSKGGGGHIAHETTVGRAGRRALPAAPQRRTGSHRLPVLSRWFRSSSRKPVRPARLRGACARSRSRSAGRAAPSGSKAFQPSLRYSAPRAVGIDRLVAVEDRLDAAGVLVGHPRAHQGAAPADGFRVDLGVAMGDAGANQRAHQAARRGACGGADGGGGQPARGNDRPEAGNGEQAETGQQAGATADHAADAGARRGRGDFIDVSVLFADILVGDQADLGGRARRRPRRRSPHCGPASRYRKRD